MKKLYILLLTCLVSVLVGCKTRQNVKPGTDYSDNQINNSGNNNIDNNNNNNINNAEKNNNTTNTENGTDDPGLIIGPVNQLSMSNINTWIAESSPTMINYLCSYTYPSSNITLHDKSVLAIEYTDPIKGKYVSTHEKLNPIESDELISKETFTAYLKGNDYGIFNEGEIEWNRPYDSTFVLQGFNVSSEVFTSTYSINTKSNTFSGTVSAGKESLFFNKAVTVTNIHLDLQFDRNHRITYLEATFLSEKKASVKVQTSYTYNYVSVTIPE